VRNQILPETRNENPLSALGFSEPQIDISASLTTLKTALRSASAFVRKFFPFPDGPNG
jgi:hypothetical protein